MQPIRYLPLRSGTDWVMTNLAGLATTATGDLRLSGGTGGAGGATTGTLTTEALDAGKGSSWYRVAIDAQVPPGTRVRVQAAAGRSIQTPPVFHAIDSLDFRLSSVLPNPTNPDPETPDPQPWRYLWLRITLETLDENQSPLLTQAQAQTGGEDYLDELPAFYRRDDIKQGHFLECLLELLGSEFGATERALDDLARRFDPAMAPQGDLDWLAQWLGWDNFSDLGHLSPNQIRALVGRLHELNEHRGTLHGLQMIVEAFTGARIKVVEHFPARRLWRLGTHTLGINTGLSPQPDSLQVPADLSGCDDSAMIVGQAVVGAQGPLEREHLGAPAFAHDAFRFTVFVPPGAVCCDSDKARLRALIDREKPAHTDYHLCFLERMQVGNNNRVGVNAFVGAAHEPKPVGQTRLGETSYLTEAAGGMKTSERLTDQRESDDTSSPGGV